MSPDPEEAIKRWGGNSRILIRLGGGSRSDVWAAEINGRPCTLRRSRRSPAALGWELDLIEFLSSKGIGVPLLVPTADGERVTGQFFVLSWVDGRPPATDEEWRAVAHTLERVHELTRSWPQRPTFASTTDLLTHRLGGDVDLDLMPPEAVKRCRNAWAPLIGAPASAIHGDPRGNAVITRSGVVLIDWDEARVDASILDLADLPGDHAPSAALAVARRAASAWEAATSWSLEPDYARRRLSELP